MTADLHTNALTLTNNNSVTTATGKVGTARDFESTSSQYLSRADEALLSYSGDFTGSVWVQLESKGDYRFIVCKENIGVAREWNLLYIESEGAISQKFAFNLWNGTTNIGQAVATTFGTPAVATWYCIQWKFSTAAAKVSIRVNGGAWNEVATTGVPTDTASSFLIGATHLSGGPVLYHDGLINQVAFWKALKSDADLNSIYNGGSGLAFASWDVSAGSDGSAAGTSTVTGVGASAALAVGTVAGTSTATATGTSTVASVGSSAGTAAATAVGRSTAAGVGNAAGVAAATGLSSGGAGGAGSASGTAVVTGVGASAAASAGSAAGTGAAAATGAALAAGVGTTAGTGTATGLSAGGASGTGSAAGVGTAAGVGRATAAAAGSAAGTCTAAGAGSVVRAGAGGSAGMSTAAAVAAALSAGVGVAGGDGAALAVGVSMAAAVGLAAGTSTAVAINPDAVAPARTVTFDVQFSLTLTFDVEFETSLTFDVYHTLGVVEV